MECERLLRALSACAPAATDAARPKCAGADGEGVARLLERHAAAALRAMQAGRRHAHWGRHSPERLVFECLLLELAARAPAHIGALADTLLALFLVNSYSLTDALCYCCHCYTFVHLHQYRLLISFTIQYILFIVIASLIANPSNQYFFHVPD